MRWPTLVCLVALSCGGPSESKPPEGEFSCKPPPALAPVLGVRPGKAGPSIPLSRIGASLNIPAKLVDRAIQRSVPVVVAEERNMSAGPAGRTTFKIERGAPRIEVTDAGLSVTVKLNGEIHLCKPFGGVCIEYGMCRPEWTARVFARSPWQLRDEPEVSLNVDITKGCILSPVKVDVTSELKKVTDAEVAKIRKQVAKEVRRYHRSLRTQLEHNPSQQASPGECLTFDIDELQLALDPDEDHYTLDVEVTGHPVWDCSKPAPAQARARLETRDQLAPTTEFHIDSDVALAALSAEWQRRVPSHPLRVTAHADELLVEVAGWQGCTNGWVVFRPTVNGSLSLEPTDNSDPTLVAMLGIPEALTQASTTHRARTMRHLQSLLQPFTIESELLTQPLELQPASRLGSHDRVHIESDTLVLRTTLQGTLSGKLSEKR